MPKRTKMLLAGAVLLLLVCGVFWNSLMSKAVSVASTQVVAKMNEKINGRLTVESIDFSFAGTLVAHQITLYDSHDAVVAKSDQISIRFGLRDLLSGNIDLQSLHSITLENPVLLADNKEGHWNFEDLIKSNSPQPQTFRGQVQIKHGVVAVGSLDNHKLDPVDGTIDFAQYPVLALDFSGKSGNTPLTAKGTWDSDGAGTMTVTADQLSLTDLPLDQFPQTDFVLTSGMARNLTVTISQQAGNLSFSGNGSVEKVAATIAGFALSEGSGNFKLTDTTIDLSDMSVLVSGQKVTMDGTISMAKSGFTILLNAASTHFDPAVLTGSSFQGPIAFQAKIEGPASTPLATGQFSIPQGSFGAVSFTAASGNFSYNGGVLTISDTKGNAWNGTLYANGDITPTTQQYKMAVTGQGVDSALLTEKDITGRVDFDAYLTGQGTTGGHASGSFRMGEGSFSGIPFLALTGEFVKQGDKISFSNILVRTVGGSFHAEGFSDGAIVRLKQVGAPVNPRDVLQKAVTDQLKKLIH
ncbi:MAG: hypothetical protein P4N59_28705 [Negativicutes bacterium]|nr:hypothetical protein [Negativicutes bacterium]